jgi:hypothetical protein
MRFLTYAESADWCSRRGYPTRGRGGIVGPEPDIQRREFHRVEFVFPQTAARRVWLARFLYGLVDPSPELLIWVGDWAVWPDRQHMPLFSRFRQAFGEHRPLIEAPGHLVAPNEMEDGVSILITSMLFVWDCHLLTSSGRDALFVCHDEWGCFGSRDASVANSVGEQLKDALDVDFRGRSSS